MVYDQPGAGFPDGLQKSAILCTSRSGSTLLSASLGAYGFDFQEFLRPTGLLGELVETRDIRRSSELAPHFVDYVSNNGRISIKTTANALQYMFAMGEFPKNLDQWRFVYPRRENLVRQAISGFIALRTGQWFSTMSKEGEVTDSDYSFDGILKLLGHYVQGNRIIERMIGILGRPCYNVVYEELLADQNRILAEIATFLGCDVSDYPDAASYKPWVERQSTDLNAEWEDRFRKEYLKKLDLGL
ncbi:MAG: Stf0 family sulfotransferase [Paracoccus sp. (in: a-proteobacteria)]|uniref:Stf0 family sulfotransferase n=1 Tax=Paracoccus sp. TaxID=267 RepID=UPI0026DF88A1|nr:Stf0 family sulfotransferase [Paracoccus sp. (in: a-proteobacteria)]MDO5622481.1 Stf0 family sulfotransferase [Paracoccus sp. (in: a-proteobacteria)]